LALLIWIIGPSLAPSSLWGQDRLGDPSAGKALYERHCQQCHGAAGWGDGPKGRDLIVPPANFHSPVFRLKSDEQVLMSIEFGVVMSSMHAWRGRLGEQEMRDLVAYVRLLSQQVR
jgi:mono/diheme cytochrome c family protein